MERDAPRPHFMLLGFPVRVSPFFLLVMAALGWPHDSERFDARFFGELALWLAIATASILWHELGHAFVMRRYGYAPSIELYGIGGRTAWGRGPGYPSAMQRVWVSLAGPFAGFLVGIPFVVLFFVGQTGTWAVDHAIALLAWINVVWGLVNLVPMVPWDGGLALEGLLDRVSGGRGRVPTAIISIAMALIAALAAWLALQSLWVVFLCGLSLAAGIRMLRGPRARAPEGGAPAADQATDGAPVHAEGDAPADVDEALSRARQSLEGAGNPVGLVSAALLHLEEESWARFVEGLERDVVPHAAQPSQRALALELVGWGHLLAGALAGAEDAIARMRPSHDPSPTLEALIALRTGDLPRATRAADAIEDEEARPLIVAYLAAARGAPEEALAALADDRVAGALIDAALFRDGLFDAAAGLGERLFERFATPEDAYNAACSHARAGRAEDALPWLGRAIEAGYDDLAHLEADADLAAVRALPGYAALQGKLAG